MIKDSEGMMLARVIKFHPQDNSCDCQLVNDGSRLTGVPMLTGLGELDVPDGDHVQIDAEHGVLVDVRDDVLRIGMALYHDAEDVDRFIRTCGTVL